MQNSQSAANGAQNFFRPGKAVPPALHHFGDRDPGDVFLQNGLPVVQGDHVVDQREVFAENGAQSLVRRHGLFVQAQNQVLFQAPVPKAQDLAVVFFAEAGNDGIRLQNLV